MHTLAAGISYADLEFQGLHRIIATAFLHGPDGIAVVDPGPSSSLATLTRHLATLGATVHDISALLLTHIHLDHAGAAGTLVRQNPRIAVFVHEAGAPHMIDPAKLLASAGRLYGDEMDRLWGEVLPVPSSAIVAVTGGESIAAGGRDWKVAYTPGHASHHVCYFAADARLAFVGDTAGVQVVRGGFVLPPTPPPDINLPVWLESLSTIEAWQPETLVLTHFGPTHSARAHLAELRDHLHLVERITREALASGRNAEDQEAFYIDSIRREMSRRMADADLRGYEVAGRLDLNWRGLLRYATKRAR